MPPRSLLRAVPLLLLLAAGPSTSGPSASGPAAALAGRYSRHFANALMDGTRYESDDVAEIVPVDPTHAYFRFSLQFANGHSCSLAGVAAADDAALVYRAPLSTDGGDGKQCRLRVWRAGGALQWDDGPDGSCSTYCGARGTFSQGDLPWASRHAIRYLPRLQRSAEYRDALAEWRSGRPQP